MNASDEVLRKAVWACENAVGQQVNIVGMRAAFEVFAEANRMPVQFNEMDIITGARETFGGTYGYAKINFPTLDVAYLFTDWLRTQVPQKPQIERKGERRRGDEWIRGDEFLYVWPISGNYSSKCRRSGGDRRTKP